MLMTTDLVNMLMPTVKMEDDRQLAAEAPTQYYDSTLLNLADNAGRMIDGAMIGPSLTDAVGTGVKAVGAVPDGTELNILGGVLTANPYAQSQLPKAYDMLQKGATPREIEAVTTWFPDQDGHMKTQVVPENTGLGPAVFDRQDYVNQQRASGHPVFATDAKLKDVLTNPNLYQDYPQAADIPVRFFNDTGSNDLGSYQSPDGMSAQFRAAYPLGQISINTGRQSLPDWWKTIEHETQHMVDELHRMKGIPHSQGGNSDWINAQISGALGSSGLRARLTYIDANTYGMRALRDTLKDINDGINDVLRSSGYAGGGRHTPESRQAVADLQELMQLRNLPSRIGNVYELGLPAHAQVADRLRALHQAYAPGRASIRAEFDQSTSIASQMQQMEQQLGTLTPYWDPNKWQPYELYRALLGETNARAAEDFASNDAMQKWLSQSYLDRQARHASSLGMFNEFNVRRRPSDQTSQQPVWLPLSPYNR